jgi:hypothetical protein
VFERQEIKDSNEACFYRLAQEGLPFMLPHIRSQRVQLSRDDFLILLREKHLMMPDAYVVEQGENGLLLTTDQNFAYFHVLASWRLQSPFCNWIFLTCSMPGSQQELHPLALSSKMTRY